MDEREIVAVADRAMHRLIKGLKLMDMGHWSPLLKGVAPLDLGVLSQAHDDPGANLGDIRKRLGVVHSTLTSVVNRLEKRGLARRVMCDRDRRSYGLELTDKGLEIHQEHKRVDRMIVNLLLRDMDDEDAREFVRLMNKAANSIAEG